MDKVCNYPLGFKLYNYLISIPGMVFITIVFLHLLSSTSTLKDFIVVFGVLLVPFMFAIFFILSIMALNPQITYNDKELKLNFLWLSKNITWDDVITIKTDVIPFHPDVIVVVVRKLSIFHRFHSLAYGEWDYPVFLIYGSINNYVELVSTLSLRAKKIESGGII